MTDVRNDPSITSAEHDSNASAKRVQNVLWNGSGYTKTPTSLFTKPYDELLITYTDSSKTTISSLVTKLTGITQETITNSSGSNTDDFVRS